MFPSRKPPFVVKAFADEGSAILVMPDGSVWEKNYDRHGAGVGSRRLNFLERLLWARSIRSAVADAWRVERDTMR